MAIEPQAPLKDAEVTKTISGLNDSIELILPGISGGKAVISGTWIGNIKFEQFIGGIVDGHLLDRWDNIGSFDGTTGAILSATGITNNTIVVFIGIAGVKKIRARFNAWTSGSAIVTLRGSHGASNVFAANLIPRNLKTEPHTRYTNIISALVNDSHTALRGDEYGIPIFSDQKEAYSLMEKAFVVTTNLITIPTNAETPFLLIKNPTGSGKILRIFEITVGLLFNNQNGIFRIYKNPTIISDGLSLSISNNRIYSGSISSNMQAFSLPTTSLNGTMLSGFPIQQNSSMQRLPVLATLILNEQNNILITIDNAANNMPSIINTNWLEI